MPINIDDCFTGMVTMGGYEWRLYTLPKQGADSDFSATCSVWGVDPVRAPTMGLLQIRAETAVADYEAKRKPA